MRTPSETLDQIAKAYKLHAGGVLDADEFAERKRELLAEINWETIEATPAMRRGIDELVELGALDQGELGLTGATLSPKAAKGNKTPPVRRDSRNLVEQLRRHSKAIAALVVVGIGASLVILTLDTPPFEKYYDEERSHEIILNSVKAAELGLLSGNAVKEISIQPEDRGDRISAQLRLRMRSPAGEPIEKRGFVRMARWIDEQGFDSLILNSRGSVGIYMPKLIQVEVWENSSLDIRYSINGCRDDDLESDAPCFQYLESSLRAEYELPLLAWRIGEESLLSEFQFYDAKPFLDCLRHEYSPGDITDLRMRWAGETGEAMPSALVCNNKCRQHIPGPVLNEIMEEREPCQPGSPIDAPPKPASAVNSTCTSSTDCADGDICRAGRCVGGGSNVEAKPSSDVKEQVEEPECQTSNDCARDRLRECRDGKCIEIDCMSTMDCGQGEKCNHDGFCVPSPNGMQGAPGDSLHEISGDKADGTSPEELSVSAGTPSVMGSGSSDPIEKVVHSNLEDIDDCYEAALRGNSSLSGKVVVKFTISPTGSVASAVIGQSTAGDAGVERCITKAIRTWSFPEPRGGGIVMVNYPFNLGR